MYTEKDKLQEYPYEGTFYRMEVDENLPLYQQQEEKVILFQTKCDILEANRNVTKDFITAKYAIYYPVKEAEDGTIPPIKFKVGDFFEAEVMGYSINGKVIGVFPSQMDAITVYIQDFDV